MAGYEDGKKMDYEDRKVWMMLLGIFQLILGGISGLMGIFIIITLIIATAMGEGMGPAADPGSMIPGVFVYMGAAVWFVWMGVGSIKCRRWARALILTSSWVWLVCGTIGMIFVLSFMLDLYTQMGNSGHMPAGAVAVVKVVAVVFSFIFLIIIPGVFVLLYGSKNAKATCEYKDPVVRWTDKCPLPVLAVSLLLCFGSFSLFLNGFRYNAIPFFGTIIGGGAGSFVFLCIAILLGFLAWGIYQLKIKAFWGFVLLVAIGTLSSVVTFSTKGLLELYEHMNLPPQTMELMRQFELPSGFMISIYTLLWGAGMLVYMFYIKRYFSGSQSEADLSP